MFNVCNTANTAVTCDEISGISGSGNPSIDHVSLAVSFFGLHVNQSTNGYIWGSVRHHD